MNESEEIKKFEQGFSCRFEVDAREIHEWAQDLNQLHDLIVDGKMFEAGALLTSLISTLYEAEEELRKSEKIGQKNE